MNLRSQRTEDLQPVIQELGRFERENRLRSERERRQHIRRLDMENLGGDAQQNPGGDPQYNPGAEEPIVNQAHGIGAQHFPPMYPPMHAPINAPMNAGGARRRIGAFDEPGEMQINLGIPTPIVENHNFELKTSLINMVQGSKFYGLPSENPLQHIDDFERLCRTVRINGVPPDAVKMMLFPFSLGDRAAQWERNIPSDLVSTWPQIKKEFTSKFFPKQKTAKIRNDIMTFRQGHDESFYEAWDRLKGYTRACPHHGVEKEALLGIFHNGVLEKYRIALDTASYGSFANLDASEGERLIENLAQSNQCYGGEYDRVVRDGRGEDLKLKELNEKLDRFLNLNQKSVHYVEHNDGVPTDYQEAPMEGNERFAAEVNYVGNQGGYQYKPFNNNLSYRSQNVENPQDQVYPPLPKQQGQGNYQNQGQGYQAKLPYQQGQGNYQPRPSAQQGNYQGSSYANQGGYQGQYNNQNKGYNNFNNQNPSNSNYVPRPQFSNFQQKGGPSVQPSQDDDIKNMFKQLLEGQGSQKKEISELKARFDGLETHVKGLENQIAQVASTLRNNEKGILPGKPEQNPKEYCQAIMLRSGKELPSEDVTENRDEPKEETKEAKDKEVPAEKKADNEVLTEENLTEKKKGKQVEDSPKTEKKTEFELPPYEPKLPFPGRFKRQILDKQYEKFKNLMNTIEVKMPLMDLLKDCPLYNKLLKDIITKKKILEEAMVQVNHECSAIIQKNLPKKLQDPGSFTLPCTIGPLSFGKCLVDLGASVSLMPLSVSKKLGLTNFKKTRISLVLADRSTRYPIGILENVPLKIGECIIPTDFVVLEMDREPTDPIILGRPFLATAGAIIDVKKGIIDLHMGSAVLKFDIMEAVKKPTIDNKVFSMEEHEAKEDELLEENSVVNPLEKVLLVEKGEYELNADSKEDKETLNSLKVDKGQKDFLELKQGVHSMEIDGLKTEEISTKEAEINDEWSELITPKTTCTHPPTANQPAGKRVRTRKKRIRTDQEEVRSIPKMGRVTRGMKKDKGDFAGNGQKEKAVVSLHAHPPI